MDGCLSVLAFCVRETFHAKFPVLVKSVFKIVTHVLPLRPTPNHPATSKLRDRRRICLFVFFLRQRENCEGAREARVFPSCTLSGAHGYAARDKKPQSPRVAFSVFISCFSLN